MCHNFIHWNYFQEFSFDNVGEVVYECLDLSTDLNKMIAVVCDDEEGIQFYQMLYVKTRKCLAKMVKSKV